jgi:hypothetical protein
MKVGWGVGVINGRSRSVLPQRLIDFRHRMGNALLTTLSNMLTDLNLTDMATCHQAFRREVVQSIDIQEKHYGFESEITVKVTRNKRLHIFEVGVS